MSSFDHSQRGSPLDRSHLARAFFYAGLLIAGLIGSLDLLVYRFFGFGIPSYANIIGLPLILMMVAPLFFVRLRGRSLSWTESFLAGLWSSLGFVLWSLCLSLVFLMKNDFYDGMLVFLSVSLAALVIQIPITASLLKLASYFLRSEKPVIRFEFAKYQSIGLVAFFLLLNASGEWLMEDQIYGKAYELEQAQVLMQEDDIDVLRSKMAGLFCEADFQAQVNESYYFYSSIYAPHEVLVEEMGQAEPGIHEKELYSQLTAILEKIEVIANLHVPQLDIYRAFLLQVDSGEVADLKEKFEVERALIKNQMKANCPDFLETEEASTIMNWGTSLIFYGSTSAEYFDDLKIDEYIAQKYTNSN